MYTERNKLCGLFKCKGRQAAFTVYVSDLAPSKSSHVIIYASSVSRISNAGLNPLREVFNIFNGSHSRPFTGGLRLRINGEVD